jgi:DNA-binding winged helix-turn-helix (wHTH) protein/predicted ATPase
MYAFGEFVLDLQLYRLRRGDVIVPLEPKVFDVLRYLVEHSDRVATKRELLEALWPNEAVTEAVLPTNINALRRALGQKRGEKWPIETIHGRGYRFSLPVTRSRPPPSSGSSSLPPPEFDSLDILEPYVGQTALMEKLKRQLARALGGQGQICILTGETGIGKTRAARYLTELARSQGADVWVGSCEPGRDGAPLGLFQQLLQSALHSQGVEAIQKWLGPLAAELHALLPSLAERGSRLTSHSDPAGVRLFDAMVRVVSQASQTRPRVLWLEDMHNADEPSWQLLRLLAPHLEHAAVLVIVTVRSRDDLTVVLPVQQNLDALVRSPIAQRFLLRGLDYDEIAELGRAVLGREVDVDLARALRDKTAGNPLFVRELLDWLDARGRSDAAALGEMPSMAPPEMIRHVLRRRVARLGQAASVLLEAAAVAGSSWDGSVVEIASGLMHDAFGDALDAAIANRVLLPVAERVDSYRFAHDLLRDTLYSDLSLRERRRLHLQLAAALEPRIGWLGTQGISEVASHLYLALPEGDPQRAVAWLERAAECAENSGVYREAARLYRSALDAARLLPVADPALSHALSASEERMASLARAARLQS